MSVGDPGWDKLFRAAEAKIEARIKALEDGLKNELRYWEEVHANGSADQCHTARQHIAAIKVYLGADK